MLFRSDIKAIEKHVQQQRSVILPAAPHPHADTPETVPVTPNQIPVPQPKRDVPPKGATEPETKSPQT